MNKHIPPPTLNHRLAGYICDEDIRRIDPAAIARTKQIISYHVGLAFRAIRREAADAKQAVSIARELSDGCGGSTIIGHDFKVTPVDAAFANCTLMRALGLDDVIFPSSVHPGLVTLPVAFAVAERGRCSGAEMLTAIIVGYELLGKFGRWTWSAQTPRRATMPFGSFGAVAVAGRLLGLTRPQMANAMGYAAHTAMGLAESDLGPVTHWYSMVCRNGLTGAYAARAGGWSSPTVLEGRFGFLQTFFGSADIDQDGLMASLGHDYQVLTTREKRYPGTALNQAAIELTRGFIAEHGLKASDIERIDIAMPVERRNFDAGHSTGPFSTRSQASSSVAFQLAILILDGATDERRNEQFDNPEIMSIVDRARVELVEGKPIQYARVELLTRDGRRFRGEQDEFIFPPESPQAVMERDAGGLLPKAKIDRFVSLLEDLENLDDASKLISCLTP